MDLTRIAGTGLYAPPLGPRFLFLLWSTTGAPDTIPFAGTWADQGAPDFVGWHAFVDSLPQGGAAGLEAGLRGALTVDRGLAWAMSAPFELRGAVPIGLGPDGRPAVTADSALVMPEGMPGLGVAADLRITALPDGLGLTDAAGQPGQGLVVALTGADSGRLSFAALLASPVTDSGSVKPLAAVWIDPLDPFSPDRTRVTPIGRSYAVVGVPGGGYRLEEAPA
ncbi:MAG: hypothetical protein KY434_10000 [Actinobacteria bacterium]|nr:hypothetical protein [Actinomycetota bacterium]